jgi:alpha-tubulin suppressor-like RCC1 family protein
VAIATGDYHSVALNPDGTVIVWGFNTAGQGDAPLTLANVVDISARGSHTMALTATATSVTSHYR